MPPRLSHLGRRLALRPHPRPPVGSCTPIAARMSITARRGYADEKTPEKATGPNQDVLGNVNEEAADLGKVTGETQPEIEQGVPVQEVLERDQEGKENAPQVIKEEISSPTNPPPSTTESSARSVTKKGPINSITVVKSSKVRSPLAPDEDTDHPDLRNWIAVGQMQAIADSKKGLDRPGQKFELPSLPLESKNHMKHRYEPIVVQVTNLIMRHGKLSVAQRNMSHILNHLRTSPPPVPSPSRPLLPGSPPPANLPLNPTLYLSLAIDSVAPLLRIRSQKGGAGGGVALQIPVPLGLRQRRRTAVQWILDAASKKKSRGSGKMQFAQRVAEEIVGVVEGRSGAWERRALVHKTGTGARANLGYGKAGRMAFRR